jgi:hypothetical protein
MKMWPAVVLNADYGIYYWQVRVLPLGTADGEVIQVSPLSMQSREWLFGDIAVFGCPTIKTFTCLPDQVRFIHLRWHFSIHVCDMLTS